MWNHVIGLLFIINIYVTGLQPGSMGEGLQVGSGGLPPPVKRPRPVACMAGIACTPVVKAARIPDTFQGALFAIAESCKHIMTAPTGPARGGNHDVPTAGESGSPGSNATKYRMHTPATFKGPVECG